ncbi:methyltransferase [Candidatus Woesearchaeota archaeon]|nr:methyltransferase [Candidatus Woesearchaeota archaeon]
MDKKKLAIYLSKLKGFENLNIKLEQYSTEGDIAADILIKAQKDIVNKTIADFGCGNGIFGIGVLLLNAKKVYFIDVDEKAIEIAKENAKNFQNAEFFCSDINMFDEKIDTVIMNPPFGVRKRKADKEFLQKAFDLADNIYSLHKIESKSFIEKISKENNFKVECIFEYNFILKNSYEFHKKKNYNVKVGLWILKRIK